MSGRGAFVTLEGIEGSGKSTLARALHARLAAEGIPALLTREPGATPLGGRIRQLLLDPASRGMDPRAELLLYCADRAAHMAAVIEPALAAGTLVVCDRYSDATRAYQGIARGLGLALVEQVNLAHREPDLTLLLDLPAAAGLERARRRNAQGGTPGETRFEEEELAFHERVRAAYLDIARKFPARVVVIDATLGPEDLLAAAWPRLRVHRERTARAAR